MVIRCLAVLALLWAAPAPAQTEVDPADLSLTITLEDRATPPFEQEMVLLTIHGIYRRHITLEKLEQPDLDGFSWMQLGQDHWYESMLDGLPVKNMRRRMALFPQRPGRLEIAPFVHHLTLLDDADNWFEYEIRSAPVALDVLPAPSGQDWWFPVRRLEITDRWSNPPDQLGEGEGVLRIVTVRALGVSPDMVPPMPDLTSPSALIFPHPEKRLVDLTPEGPVSLAFWRWTIKPRNPPSAILEPIEFSYFDTVARQNRNVKISAQRVAMTDAGAPDFAARMLPAPTVIRTGALALALLASLSVGSAALLAGRRVSFDGVRSWLSRQRLKARVRRCAASGDLAGLRRACHALNSMTPPDPERDALLRRLDRAIFGQDTPGAVPEGFAARFRETLSDPPGRPRAPG